MSGFWDKLFETVGEAARGIGNVYLVNQILERKPSDAFRELIRHSFSDSKNEFKELLDSIESRAKYGGQHREAAAKLIDRYERLNSLVIEIVKLLDIAPAVARLEVMKHVDEMPDSWYSDFVFLLTEIARNQRNNAIAEFAEYAVRMGRERH